MPLTRRLAALGMTAVVLGCSRPTLPEPVRPLAPTPDAPFRAAPPLPFSDAGATSSAAPEIESAVLPNGLSVWVVHQPELPYVALEVASRGAGLLNGSESPELTRLALRSVVEGGTVWTDLRVIEPPLINGQGVEYHIDPTHARLQLRVVSANLEEGAQALGRTVQAPAFDARDVDDALRAELQRLQDQSAGGSNTLFEIIFKAAIGEDAAKQMLGTDSGELVRAGTADVERCYRELFRPETSALIAVGDVTLSQLLPVAERTLGGWTASAPAPAAPVRPAPTYLPTARRVHLVPQPDYGQAHVMLLQPAPGAGAAQDELAFLVMAQIALGGLRSRANLGLRHDAGVTYGVSPTLIDSRRLGFLLIEASLETGETVRALSALLRMLRELQERPVTDEELRLAKVALSARSERILHDNYRLSQSLASVFAAGRPATWLGSFAPAVAAVTASDVQRVARLYLRPDQVEIGVLGSAALGEDLARLGELSAYHIQRTTPGEGPDE